MQEIGRGKLLKAVDIANDIGSPTLSMVEQILLHGLKDAADGPVMDKLDKAILDDDFYVEQREPSEYDSLWGSGCQAHPKNKNDPDKK